MKRFLSLIAAGLITCAAADSFAQGRDLGANRIILDDTFGGLLTMSYGGPGNATFVFPPFPSTTVPFGNSPWQTLAWDDVNAEWDLMNNLTNDGSMITATTQITSTVPNGTAPFVISSTDVVTNLNADLLDGWHASDFSVGTNAPLTGGDLLVNNPVLGISYDATLDLNGSDLSINTGNANTWTATQALPATAAQGDNLIASVNAGSTTINAVRIGNGLTNTQVNDDLTISGGSVNNSPVGNTTPSTGAFTTLSANNTVTFSALGANLPVKTNGSSQLTAAAINLASATEVINTLPINRGGTNSSTALAGNSIMVSNGSAIVQGNTGSATQVLHGDLTYSAVNLTTDVSGILPTANGGTGINGSAAANGNLLIGNGAGFSLSPLTPTPNRLSVTNGAGTITLDIAATYVGQNTITTLGTIGTGTWQGTAVADGFVADNLTINAGTISASPINSSSIGATTPSTGAFTTLSANSTVTFSGLAANLPVKTGVGGVLSAAGINLASATEVLNTLPINRGGTNSNAALNNGRVMVSTGGAIVEAATGANGDVLTLAAGVPTWVAPTSSTSTLTRKTADETIASAAMQADNHITINMAANETRTLEGILYVTAEDTDTEFDIRFNSTNNMTAKVYVTGREIGGGDAGSAILLASSATNTNEATIDIPVGTVGIMVHGVIINGGTASTVTLQWSQNITEAGDDTTVEINSYIRWF